MTATLTLFHNGLSAGVSGMPNHNAKRGGLAGWSTGAARRHQHFLYSVNVDVIARECTVAYAFTLTVLVCPESPKAWADAVNRFLLSMCRTLKCMRLHWVVEWQRRQVPHLHGCLFFPVEDVPLPDHVVGAWCYLVRLGARAIAQTVKPITGLTGWLQYVAKHAARGVKHYQRSGDAIPPSWRGQTGRMWGHRGDWPLAEPLRFSLDGREGDGAFFPFRRLVRLSRIADARLAITEAESWLADAQVSGDSHRIESTKRRLTSACRRLVSARRMLKCGNAKQSEVRGVSEWFRPARAQMFLSNLLRRGYSIGLPSRETPGN
jgi:hypothetical protein